VCGGNAALCQITLITCYNYLLSGFLVRSHPKSGRVLQTTFSAGFYRHPPSYITALDRTQNDFNQEVSSNATRSFANNRLPRDAMLCPSRCLSNTSTIINVSTELSRYLGVFIVSSRSFKCSLVHAKRSFYAAVNGLLGKLLNLSSEEVILELVRAKCIPILLYGLECVQLG